jgi:hypothetical protein
MFPLAFIYEQAYGKDYIRAIHDYVSFDQKTKCHHQAVRWFLFLACIAIEVAFPIIWGW